VTGDATVSTHDDAGSDTSPPAASLNHLPKLDGVRALAILAVMFYHANWLQCGWAGVQAFFVLSGFLITRILLKSKERWRSAADSAGRTGLAEYFGAFYWRRALRIFPLYYAFIVGLAVIFMATGHPAQLKTDLPWLLSYTINIERIFPGYHSAATHSHLWSLAVEEQFYLIWPAVIWLLPKAPFRRLVWGLILAGPLLRLTAGCLSGLLWHDPLHAGEVVYNLLSSHADAFAAGAAVSMGEKFFVSRPLRKLVWAVIATAVAGAWMLFHLRALGHVGFVSLGYPHNMPWSYQYVWGYSLLNLTFALLIAVLLQPYSAASRDPFRFLELPAITYLGRISYGLYIFHNPAQVLVARLAHIPDYTPLSIPAFLLSAAVTVAIAALSFHFMESWFLKFKDRQPWSIPGFAPGLPAKDAVGG